MNSDTYNLRKKIRLLILLFMTALVLSGITAYPITKEAKILYELMGPDSTIETIWPEMSHWISTVHQGVSDTKINYEFIFYGTDWLAFAHIVIAIAFIGPLRDPVKNLWVIEFGMIACILVIPHAIILGYIREIPIFWQIVDCAFGIFGIIPLWIAKALIGQIETLERG